MSGKSNILDVFHFLYQVFFPEAGTQGIQYALAQRGGINEILWKGGDEKLITIGLEVVDPSDKSTKYKYSLELIAGAGDYAATQSESLKLLRNGAERDLILHEPSSLRLKNADGTDVGNIGTVGISAVQYAHPNWDGYKFYEWVRLFRFYHLVPSLMKQPSMTPLGQVLTQAGDNLSAWLMWLQTNSPEAFGRLNEVLRDLFPDVVQLRTIPTADGKVHLATTEKGLKRPTAVWQTSDGFLNLVALLSLIYIPEGLRGTLFCIEEPENHLHPRLLETVVEPLRQVRQEALDSDEPLTQIILTTQSPYLVDKFSLDEIIWIEKKRGESRSFRPADKLHLRTLIENKDLGLGDLMFSGALGQEK